MGKPKTLEEPYMLTLYLSYLKVDYAFNINTHFPYMLQQKRKRIVHMLNPETSNINITLNHDYD